MAITVDKSRLLEAAELKARILRNADRRSACWRTRNAERAEMLEQRLEDDWQLYREARAAALAGTSVNATVCDHPVDRFLNERCQITAQVLTPTKDVHNAYLDWASDHDEDAITPMRLTQELKHRGVETARTKSARMYRGIAIL